MLYRAATRLKKFNEENPRFVGYCTGVTLMTVVYTFLDIHIDKKNEEAGFKNIRLYKDTDTGDISAEDTYGNCYKVDFPQEEV